MYLAVLRASYDYQPQSEDEIEIVENQLLLLIERVDDEWWKVKGKDAESQAGLVPAAYVEQPLPTNTVRALYDYDPAAPSELALHEHDLLHVFDTEDDWILVQHTTLPKAGYVPANYVEDADDDLHSDPAPVSTNTIIVPDSPPRPAYVDPADRVAQSRPAAPLDDILTWAVSEIDQKGKKKKGTLGVGNGNVFFASESDKTPVQKWQTHHIATVISDKPKHLRLDITAPTPTTLHFHAGSKDHADAIIAKLLLSKSLASPPSPSADHTTTAAAPDTNKKASVHFSNASPVIIPDPDSDEEHDEHQHQHEDEDDPHQHHDETEHTEEVALALYDFTADGEDELSVTEGERLVVLEKDGDEWWKCRNAHGGEGVVPASYLESTSTSTSTPTPAAPKSTPSSTTSTTGAAAAAAAARSAAEARRAQAATAAAQAQADLEAEEAAAAELEAEELERERQDAETAAATAAAEQQARDQRAAARKAEAQRKAKEAARAAEEQRKQRVDANANARAVSPPVAAPPRTSTSSNGTKSELTRPPPEKTRVWHDRSGQFRVEAAFLGFNNGKLRLHKVNGVIVEVPSEKMSIEDMKYAERFVNKANAAKSSSGGDRNRNRDSRDRDEGDNGMRLSGDDIPLAIVRAASSGGSGSRQSSQPQQPKKPKIDWFDFFLSAGCDLDDCTRYAASFERDKMDEGLLVDITESTMRSLGLREGDILRVKRAIEKRKPGDNAVRESRRVEEQLRRDEELARALQAQDGANGGVNGAATKNPPNLFANAQGVLKQPRRGRPQTKPSVPLSVVDMKAIGSASEQIQRTASPLQAASPVAGGRATPVIQPPARTGSAPLIDGFEDNAWTPRPSSTKPQTVASPPPQVQSPALVPTPTTTAPAPAPAQTPTPAAVPAAAPTTTSPPSLANTTESDIFEQLAKLSVLRQNSAPPPPAPQPQQQQQPPQQAQQQFQPPQQQQQQQQQQQFQPQRQMGSSPAFGMNMNMGMGMGAGSSPVPMGQLSPPTNVNAPRGPFAPVPANQGLLAPLIPVPTGFPGSGSGFVPTKAPTLGMGMAGMNTGMGGGMGGGMSAGMSTNSMLSASPFGSGTMAMSPPPFLSTQPTGFNPNGGAGMMMAQPTGFNPAFAQPQQQQQQPMMTQPTGAFGGFGGGAGGAGNGGFGNGLQSQITGFNAPMGPSMFGPGPASPPPPLPSNPGNNTSPANVFAQMKSGTFASDNNSSLGSNNGLNGQTPAWGQSYQGYTGY